MSYQGYNQQAYGQMGMGNRGGMMNQQAYGGSSQAYGGNNNQTQSMGMGMGSQQSYMGYGPMRTGRSNARSHPYGGYNSMNANVTVGQYGLNSRGYPIRPGQKTCSYFEKCGRCQYGTTCKWNHPEEVIQMQEQEKSNVALNSKGYPLRPGEQPCKYYSEWGICSFGATCRWDHPENIQAKQAQVSTTAQGYPLRPEAKECEFYMKTGQCKFGVTCKFNHPPNMGGTQKMAMDRCIPCTTFNEKGYPSRPGQPQCQFYMKTGECKFGATCRFDHPFHVQVTPHLNMRPADRVNSKGLPLRPGVQPCSFYMKTGDCKFGITCKFDHPEMSQERFSELKAAQFNQVGATQGQVVNTGSVMQVSESNNVDTKAEPAAVDSLQPQEKAEDEPRQSEAVESKEE